MNKPANEIIPGDWIRHTITVPMHSPLPGWAAPGEVIEGRVDATSDHQTFDAEMVAIRIVHGDNPARCFLAMPVERITVTICQPDIAPKR